VSSDKPFCYIFLLTIYTSVPSHDLLFRKCHHQNLLIVKLAFICVLIYLWVQRW